MVVCDIDRNTALMQNRAHCKKGSTFQGPFWCANTRAFFV